MAKLGADGPAPVLTDFERHQAYAGLLDARERGFRTLVDNVPDLIVRMDRDLRIQYANRACEAVFGVSAELARDQTALPSALPDAVLALWRQHGRTALDTGLEQQCSFTLERGGGSNNLSRVVPETARDGLSGSVLIVTYDVSERVAREHEREALLTSESVARKEAEALSRAKDEFLAVVSDELRSPLNAIRGWTNVLRHGEGARPSQERALDAIERNTQAQARLIDDLLDMQRSLRGELILHLRVASLAQVVERAIASVRPEIAGKRIALRVDHDPQVGNVRIDVDRMCQVVGALLCNACKFTASGGSITVRARRTGEAAVTIEVIDTGAGIAPDLLLHVFDRFHQGDASTTRRHRGLGLGLALARQLVEHHGGRLTAASPGAGQGSAFTVALPARREAPPSVPAARTTVPTTRGRLASRRVMVVEDDADSRDVLALLLREAGAVVQPFASAGAALKALAARGADTRPDAIVSDIAMPGADGHSLLRRLRALEHETGRVRLPAVALTAFSAGEDQAASLAAGFDAHLAKPIDVTRLVDLLARLLAQADLTH